MRRGPPQAAGRRPQARGSIPLAALLALALPVAGCRGIPYAEPRVEGEYGTALMNQTRRAVLYESLETRAFVHVVWVTPEFAAAQAERISRMRAEPADAAAARRAQMKAEAAAPTFFAVVFTPDAAWNDWDSKKTSWRVALEAGGAQREPISVERIERPFSPELAALYPYADDFHTCYKLRFPPGPVEAPKLIVAGALGRLEFTWSE